MQTSEGLPLGRTSELQTNRVYGQDMSLLLAAALIIPAGQAFTCTPTHVWDGDGPVWCSEGPRIRLSGIAAREIDGTAGKASPALKQAVRPRETPWCD
jgi:endonuclease YncB( thermonuclease family)